MIMNEKGFTLIETLIALSILSILLLLPMITLPNFSANSYEAPLSAKQLKEDLLLAQHLAMSTGRQTFVRIDNTNRKYVIRFSALDVYLERPYINEQMFIELVTLEQSSISFLENGHPSQSGSFILKMGDQHFRFTIYLGKGAISYTKL